MVSTHHRKSSDRSKPIRVLIAKPGLDGHESGAKVIARALADAGMEVVYTGTRQTPQMIANVALQEDVGIVGLSILSGAHKELCARVVALFKEKGLGDVPIIVGGIIPYSDVPDLEDMGIKAVFDPGTTTARVVACVRDLVSNKRAGRREGAKKAMRATEEPDDLSLLVRYDDEGPYLVGGKCAACEAVIFPKQSICPRCTGRDITETRLSRKGRLHTYTEVYQKPPDYEGPVPYLIGRVLLPEGVFILAHLRTTKGDLKIGGNMELVVEPIYRDEGGKDIVRYGFRPAK